jgi:DNA-binding transcriptional regulator YhcF (GntR family)
MVVSMSKAADIVQHLCEAFERILAHPPSKVGRRLCSERELATRLQVERITIQKAFDQLVEKGYIARRHGSGTYVRKVPPASRGKIANINGQSFTAADFFAEPASTPARKQALQEHRRLKVAFLDKVGLQHNEMRSLLYSGVMNRLKESGHQVKLVQFEKADEELVSLEEAMAKIHDNPCDGYILWAPMIPKIDPTFLKAHAPVSYVAGGERISDHDYSPLTRIGTEDAFVRAVRLLKEVGHSKIAYFSNYGLGMTGNLQRFYDITLGAFDLEYRRTEFLEPNDDQIAQRMRKLFNGPDRPEAVYIADDILLRRVAPVLEKLNVIPGNDVGVVTLSNRGVSLPAKYKWSRLEFDPFQLGRLAADNLLLEIQNAGEVICSVENLATWYPGTTHICQ